MVLSTAFVFLSSTKHHHLEPRKSDYNSRRINGQHVLPSKSMFDIHGAAAMEWRGRRRVTCVLKLL